MATVIVKKNTDKKRMCKNCNKLQGENIMECPFCESSFCSGCFVGIPEGNRKTIKCPKCKKVLSLPKKQG